MIEEDDVTSKNNPSSNMVTLDVNEENVVTDKMLDDVLFGSEPAVVESCCQSGHQSVLTPVLQSSPISCPPQGNGTTKKLINETIEDILFGLCPEDLNFSRNTSNISECAKTLAAGTEDEGLNKSADGITRTKEVQFIKSSALLSNKAMEVNTTSDRGTFYGLPLQVKECYEEFRIQRNKTALWCDMLLVNYSDLDLEFSSFFKLCPPIHCTHTHVQIGSIVV